MAKSTKTKAQANSKSPQGELVSGTFNFATEVVKSIKNDDMLRVLWGVEVLLFAILGLVLMFGGLKNDQPLYFALSIVGSVVLTFLITMFRWGGVIPKTGGGTPTDSSGAAEADPTIVAHARRCRELIEQISGANARLIERGRSGDETSFSRLLSDRYNHICRACADRRDHTALPPDDYLDALSADLDVKQVCDSKYYLGEAVDDLRSRLNASQARAAADFDDWELLVRRSITQPDLSPARLADAANGALRAAAALKM